MSSSWILRLVLLPALLAACPGTVRGAEPAGPVASVVRPGVTVTPQDPPRRLDLHLDDLHLEQSTSFEPRFVIDLDWEREMRLSLWNDPQGRVAYNLAAELSMVGRTGLVHGGHMLGVGLGTTAIGDGRSPVMRLMHRERSWRELSGMEKIQVGTEVAVGLGILWAILQALQ